MAGMSILQNTLEDYKCDANSAVVFKLVRQLSDIENESINFKPEMSHQIFGESETIFGYKDLRVELYYTASRLNMYVNVKYSDKISPQKFDGVAPDNIEQKISENVGTHFTTNLDHFVASLSKEASFKPFGEMVHSYTVETGGFERQFEIYKASIDEPGFREYHHQLQQFILWYIDAASYIDVDDEKWTFYLLFEKYKASDGAPMYAVAGYATVYNYYAYPEKIRPRISQVLVLPPFQKQGHCSQLLQTFYNDCIGKAEILDITVEDPSDNFQRVRDFVDVKNCINLPSFQPEFLLQGFTEEMAKMAQQKLKINKKQARRVYEILRLQATNENNPAELKKYRLSIKNRLNAPFQKKCRDFEKLSKVLSPDELAATMSNETEEQRLNFLETEYEELYHKYKRILERVAMS